MKKLAIILMACSGYAYSGTDYTCVAQCQDRGNVYSQCQTTCTYNDDREDWIASWSDCESTCMTNSGWTLKSCELVCKYRNQGYNMKKITLILTVILSGNALAGTDYTCVNRCSANGYQYQYCQSKCSYNDNWGSSNIDYTCQNRCTANGYMYQYCQQACSY